MKVATAQTAACHTKTVGLSLPHRKKSQHAVQKPRETLTDTI